MAFSYGWMESIVAFVLVVCVAGCGGGNGDNNEAPSDKAPVVVGQSVPTSVAGLIKSIHAASVTITPGEKIERQTNGTFPVLVATDMDDTPYLLAIGSSDGVMNADSTSVSLVRVGLDLVQPPGEMTNPQINQAISESPSYNSLRLSVEAALESARSPLLDDGVVTKAWDVIREMLGSLGSSVNNVRYAVHASSPVAPPLPFYLINNSEPYARIWLDDIPGTLAARARNQTFISWSLTSEQENGALIDTKVASPLSTTSLQLIAYYGGSASTTDVTGVEPKFTLILSQNTETRRRNGIASALKYYLFLVSATVGYYPNGDTNNCILGVVSSIFNEKFPDFAVQPNATSAAEYFAKLLPVSGDEVYKKFSQCGKLPTPTQIFGSTIGTIWRALNLTRSLVNTVGTVGETFNYWTYESSFLVCKHSGNIVTCNDNKVELSQAACTKTYPTPGGPPLYSVTVSGNAESSDLRDFMQLRFNSRSCFGCHGGGTIRCSKGWIGTHLGVAPVTEDTRTPLD